MLTVRVTCKSFKLSLITMNVIVLSVDTSFSTILVKMKDYPACIFEWLDVEETLEGV